MFDDLEGLTVPNVVEAYNRTILAARQFCLTLHGQAGFRGLGFEGGLDLQKDGGSSRLTQNEDWFQVSTAICTYRSKEWPVNLGAFAGFYLLSEDDDAPAELCVGAYWSKTGRDLPYSFGGSWEPEAEVELPSSLGSLDRKTFIGLAITTDSYWVYALRPWSPGAAVRTSPGHWMP